VTTAIKYAANMTGRYHQAKLAVIVMVAIKVSPSYGQSPDPGPFGESGKDGRTAEG
jgi:hypothetical protein